MQQLTHQVVQGWLDGYLEAWRTNDADQIAALFTEDATYRYHPTEPPLEGRNAIVAWWLGDADDPGRWTASYSPWVVEGDRAVATGTSIYTDLGTFLNCYQLTFREGRCSEFIEWYMQPKEGS
jgi:ketosteroid isomerase-like protein